MLPIFPRLAVLYTQRLLPEAVGEKVSSRVETIRYHRLPEFEVMECFDTEYQCRLTVPASGW